MHLSPTCDKSFLVSAFSIVKFLSYLKASPCSECPMSNPGFVPWCAFKILSLVYSFHVLITDHKPPVWQVPKRNDTVYYPVDSSA